MSYSNPPSVHFTETFKTKRTSYKLYDGRNEKFEFDIEFSSSLWKESRSGSGEEDEGGGETEGSSLKRSLEMTAENSEDTEKFNPFLYYYISPEMPLDLDLVEAGRPPRESGDGGGDDQTKEKAPSLDEESKNNYQTNEENKKKNNDNNHGNITGSMNDTADAWELSDDSTHISTASAAPIDSENNYNNLSIDPKYKCVVPEILIEYFVLMTDSNHAIETDTEIPQHCAFSFPAVALTLGRNYWPLLKDAYLSLASAIPWKVRRTLASSIHEVAIILGEDLAARDLVPIYDGFIKDLDEVRIGALKHLATFLKVLRPAERCQYLPRLNDFLVTDNEWNWRFREELANQLLEAVTLFNPYDVSKYIAPLSLHLLVDKIAAVRSVALALVSFIFIASTRIKDSKEKKMKV